MRLGERPAPAALPVRRRHRPHAPAASSSAPLPPPPPPCPAVAPAQRRRGFLLASCALAAAAPVSFPSASVAAAADDSSPSPAAPPSLDELEASAKQAYSERRLPDAVRLLSLLAAAQPAEPVWLERRAQAQLDLKHFDAALADFEAAVRLQPPGFVSLGLLANRALAREGLADWAGAAADYRQSLALASQLGFDQPYLRNSLGNCLASQGRYAEARGEYKAAAETFRSARNLAGTIYAESNAALMDAQIGDVDAARALEAVARKAPGSIDARAALAAVRYEIGDTEGAEAAWNWACTRINSGQLVPGGSVYDGCAAYRDDDWLRTIRRWPPRLREDMSSFLALRPVGAGRR